MLIWHFYHDDNNWIEKKGRCDTYAKADCDTQKVEAQKGWQSKQMTLKMYLMICYYCWKNKFCWNKFKTCSWVLFIFQIFSSTVFTQNNVFCKVFFEQQKYLIDRLYHNYIMKIMEQLPKVKIQDNRNISEISTKKCEMCLPCLSSSRTFKFSCHKTKPSKMQVETHFPKCVMQDFEM